MDGKSGNNGFSSLSPTANTMNVSLPIPQKLTSSGSATGNPRNKCALQPGHSLMDWIRLGNSGVDLAGTRGRVMPVNSDELAKHNTQNDAWLAIRGRVYNVTRYMDFHPGGVEELMRAVGRDATKLFDEVHAWVNYQQLLAKCYIGPLKHVVKLDADLAKALNIKTTKNSITNLPPVPTTKILDPIEVVPRFDWIQSRSTITFYIYTRQFCNPGLILQRKNDKRLQLRIEIALTYHEFSVELEQSIAWPPKLTQIASESGKIELIFNKTEQELWTSYGSHTSKRLTASDELEEIRFEYNIVHREDINHDSFELELQSNNNNVLMLLPVGYHVRLIAQINAAEVARSYTPIASNYLEKISTDTTNSTSLYFLIKSYEKGILSAYLKTLQPAACLQLTAPKGNFKLTQLMQHKHLLLTAAGSGLTPILNLIAPLLKRSTNRLQRLELLYFNKTEEDIWCRQYLEQLQQQDDRFIIQHIISQPATAWSGLSGRISKDLLTKHVANKQQTNSSSFVIVCGPNAFNQTTLDILREMEFNDDCVHVFQ